VIVGAGAGAGVLTDCLGLRRSAPEVMTRSVGRGVLTVGEERGVSRRSGVLRTVLLRRSIDSGLRSTTEGDVCTGALFRRLRVGFDGSERLGETFSFGAVSL